MHTQYFVTARTQLAGYHRWPEAPHPFEYLRERHRHLFTMAVRMSVSHGDRDIEVNQLEQHMLTNWQLLANRGQWPGEWEFDGVSCEHMAVYMATNLLNRYPTAGWVQVEVLGWYQRRRCTH